MVGFAKAAYAVGIQLVLEKSIYSASEQMVMSGSVAQSNLSASDTAYAPAANASINITIFENATGNVSRNYTLTAAADGTFRSNSSSSLASTTVLAPNSTGAYYAEASYTDPGSAAWRTKVSFTVLDQVIDDIIIRPLKASYYAGEQVTVFLEAVKRSGQYKVPVSNVSLNGTLRYENLTTISQFNCTTATNGACSISLSAPSAAGKYILEAKNFLAASSFRVIPFNIQAYMKDGLGQSFKEIFRAGEDASVEVRVDLNGSSPTGTYTFNGTILNSNSTAVANITSTTLESNNSYTNKFTFAIGNQFSAGNYFATVTAYDSAGRSRSATIFFQVRGWTLVFYKASTASGFEYEYVAFPGRALGFEIYPKDRQNGSIITGLNATQFNITLKDQIGTILAAGNASWNSTCGSSGCYAFNLTSPSSTGSYVLSVSLNHSSDVQKSERKIMVTDLTLSALSTSETGEQKDLFGTTEPVYIKLAATNTTSPTNLTEASLMSVTYENGTEFTYANTTWFGINVTDNTLHWAWNASEQKLKLDPPKSGGVYTVKISANSNAAITTAAFVVNPYDVCAVAKSAVGSVDSSTSWYVWQYKTTDTVYFEMKISQANNPAGRANSTLAKNTSNFGMGSACTMDTTKQQVVSNATITISKVWNSISGVTNSLNATESMCKADDNQGAYTCTLKPLTRWESGRNIVEFSVLGSDMQTTDKVIAIFESRTFFIYGYPTTWANKPESNISFTLYLYKPGSSWWGSYGSGGLSGSATVQKVQYFGKAGEWVYPPVEYPYNTSGLNASTVTSGAGSFTLQHTLSSKGVWDVGSYSAIVKVTDSASGESDYGEIWFEIKRWDVYAQPAEKTGSAFNYKYSFNTRENATLYVRITNAGDWNDAGGTSLGGNVSVGVKRLEQYVSWPPKEFNSSAYGYTTINVNQSNPWMWTANADTYSNYLMTIYPVGGRWESGYYNLVLDINGTDTGWGWFNVISFTLQSQPTDANGTNYVYNTKGRGAVYFNVSATKSWKWSYSPSDYVNTTFEDLTIRTWRQAGSAWQAFEYNYPEDINVSVKGSGTRNINGSAVLNVTLLSGNWPSGWYSGDLKVRSVSGDSAGDSSTGYLYFNVQPFRVQSSISSYQVDYDSNVTATLSVYEPDWSSNTLVTANYSIVKITESQWTGTGSNYITYSSYTPRNFTNQTQLNISPVRSGSTKWSLSNSGYRYLTITVQDINTGSSQDAWLSFRAMPMQISIGSPYGQNSITSTQNVTVPVTITSSSNGSAASGNVSSISEWSWPTRNEYAFSVGTCSSVTSGSCKITGTQNVTIHVPSGGWSDGWHYPELLFTPTDDKSSSISAGSTWFQVTQAYSADFSNHDENNAWKYYFGFNENASVKLTARDSGWNGKAVNVTRVQYAESGSNCWSDYCRTYVDASWQIVGASQAKPNETSASGSVIRIIKPSAGWQRGEHVVKVSVAGPLGTGTLKSGYFWVKDNTAPNVTISSPVFNSTINSSTFTFSATTTEDASCSLSLANYNSYYSWYCWWAGNSTNTSAAAPDYMTLYTHTCNSTLYNGSTYYTQWVSRWSDSSLQTGGTSHSYTFRTAGMPTQHYALYTWCNDADWNNVFAASIFWVNVSNVTQPVNVTLLSPANNSIQNTSNTTFLYNLNGPVSDCYLYSNATGTWTFIQSASSLAGANHNFSTSLNNGTYVWNVKCSQTTNSSNYDWGDSNRTLFINITNVSSSAASLINVSLASPTNNYLHTNASNVTFYFNLTGPSSNCNLFTNKTGNWSYGPTLWSISQGSHNFSFNMTNGTSAVFIWNVLCQQTQNYSDISWGASNRTLHVNTTVVWNPVSVTLTSPAQNYLHSNASNMTFAYNFTGPVSDCSLYNNKTETWSNWTGLSSLSQGQHSFAFNITNGTSAVFIWNVKCHETSNTSNSAWGASNRTLYMNITTEFLPVNVTALVSPSNGATVANQNASFTFNFTGPASNCTLYGNFTGTYASNSTNNSLSQGSNYIVPTPGLNLRNGTYIWNTKCIDSTNSSNFGWGASNFTFSINNSTIAGILESGGMTGMATATSGILLDILNFIAGSIGDVLR